jgi:hypothetical protein
VLPLLVGEANPYGADPRYALYPYPERASGHRLATLILGLTPHEYLRRFERVNLCPQKWSMKVARPRALELEAANPYRRPFVLLGRKVADAFGLDIPFFSGYALDGGPFKYYLIPHPSGLCREWNAPDAVQRARLLLDPLLEAQ